MIFMSKKLILFCFYIVLSSCNSGSNSNTEPEVIAENNSIPKPRAIVIKHGWDVPIVSLALTNANFINEVENSPYDGIIFSVGDVSNKIFSGKIVDKKTVDAAFNGMNPNTFSREMHNFVKLNVFQNIGNSPYEGKHLSNLIKNIKLFASAAKKAGFKGIAFDNENYYDNNIWGWSNDNNSSICPDKTREECKVIVRNAGDKIMQAILEEWNSVKFMPFFGIWLRNESSWNVIMANSSHNKWYDENKLEADFLVGIYKAIHDKKELDANCIAEFIDGGEIYSIRTRAQFKNITNHLRNELSTQAPQFLDYLRTSYAKNVKIGFGIYDFKNSMFGIPPLNAKEFVDIIRNGAPEADYLWLYPELYDYWNNDGNNWPEKKAPLEWKNEINNALK